MGALTDNRKRCFVDLCFPVSPPSSPFVPQSELLTDNPLSKKLKFSSSLPPASVQVGQRQQKQVAVKPELPRFPPAAPLRRTVQGPQRNIKVFGLGKPGTRSEPERWALKEKDNTMGNFLSRVGRKTGLSSVWRSRKGKDSVEDGRENSLGDGSPRGLELELEDYKRLVEGLHGENSAGVGQRSEETTSGKFTFPRTPSAAVLDLRVLTREDKETPVSHILNRKVEDTRVVKVELTPGNDEVRWTKKTPLYKDLLQETARKYDSKLSSLDFEVKLAEKKISEFRIVSAEKPKEDLLEPFAPLTDQEENDIDLALRDPVRSLCWSDVLVLHEASNIAITRESIQCLRHGVWLNDEVINLYFELLKEREKRDPKKFLKCHFFNTFFYKKLTSGRDRYDFKSVRRWTTQKKIGYGLIECDKIFVPIHKEIHWCLAVIDVKDEKFQYLDSLGGMDNQVLSVLARYLTDEANDKSNTVIDVSSWKQEIVDGLPKQRNSWDCGMFMIKYADFYSRGLGLCFGQENMSYFRRRTVKELLNLRAE